MSKGMEFVSLHSHSTFSYGDGFGPVKDHVDRIASLGMGALALTEHGNLSSHVQLEKACRAKGVKPIFGCELYLSPPEERRKWHQTVVAMDEEGLQNLNKIVTQSYHDMYQFPTVTWDNLRKHSAGLIVLSGCADSLLSCALLGGKSYGDKRLEFEESHLQHARRIIEQYQKVFGDRYYLEVQRFPGLERTCVLNPAFAELSRECGARLVATADVHYPFPTDNEMQKILHASHRGSTVAQTEASWEYDILLTYPESDGEITNDLQGTGLSVEDSQSAVSATSLIADRCNVELPKNQPIRFPRPANSGSAREYIMGKLNEGWKFRKFNKLDRDDQKKYKERVEHEIGLIADKDFIDYFLMLSDVVSWAKDQKIPVGPARGSAAASLVCYLLRITEVNPLQFPHMLFERFIDPTRTELPDVDLDFSDDRRIEVKRYLERKYGKDRVGNIGNFTRYRGKNSIDDVARVYGIPAWECNTIKDLIIERSGGDSRISDSLEDTFAMFPKARDVLQRYPELHNAVRLEGNYRGMGVHAAGIVISNTPITDTCAVYTRQSAGESTSVIAYDKKDGEYVGMLKADFLGLSTMGMLGKAIDTIGMDLEELYQIPLDDERTMDAFRRNDLTGIFQFEGRATRIVCRDVRPDHFQHLADINALSRPGPLFSGMAAQYVGVRHGNMVREKLHPIVDALTDWTYGQIVYQEQVLTIIRELGGFPMSRVHDIRKIISQKLGEASFEAMYQEFEDGCQRLHGVEPDLAQRIWRFMATSATYSFNIAHCVSYSMLAFWQMWIKQHHPTAFYAAQLSKVGDDKLFRLMQDAINGERFGRPNETILPPSLEESGVTWAKTGDTIRAGFLQVPGIGPKTADVITAWRDEKLKTSKWKSADILEWDNLSEIKGIGPKGIEKIKSFTSMDDPFGLETVKNTFVTLRSLVVAGNEFGIPVPTHVSSTIPKSGVHQGIVWMGIPFRKNYQDYIENQRSRYGKEEDEIIAEIRQKHPGTEHLVKSCVVQCKDDYEDDVYCRWNRFTFPKFEKMLESLQTDGSQVLIVRGIKREDFGTSIHVRDAWVLDLTEDEDE